MDLRLAWGVLTFFESSPGSHFPYLGPGLFSPALVAAAVVLAVIWCGDVWQRRPLFRPRGGDAVYSARNLLLLPLWPGRGFALLCELVAPTGRPADVGLVQRVLSVRRRSGSRTLAADLRSGEIFTVSEQTRAVPQHGLGGMLSCRAGWLKNGRRLAGQGWDVKSGWDVKTATKPPGTKPPAATGGAFSERPKKGRTRL
jgi:hypothetical protein